MESRRSPVASEILAGTLYAGGGTEVRVQATQENIFETQTARAATYPTVGILG
jgi:hypothetical protein